MTSIPTPTAAQLAFMGLEMTQFMHFGIPTFWDPPSDFLHTENPTYHDCHNMSDYHTPILKQPHHISLFSIIWE